MDMLKDFQNRQRNCLEENCKREEQKLAERTSIRRAVIEKKVCSTNFRNIINMILAYFCADEI